MPKSRLLHAAFICGLLPLRTGVGIFLLWFMVRWGWLIVAGVFTIYGSVLSVLVGLGFLVAHVVKRPAGERKSSLIWSTPALGVLLVNFPAAALVAVAALDILTCFTVTVANNGPTTLDSFVVSGGGVEVDFGPIAPSQALTRHFFIQNDGELVFHARRDGEEIEGTVEGYVTHNQGGHKRIIFDQAGQVEVLDLGKD